MRYLKFKTLIYCCRVMKGAKEKAHAKVDGVEVRAKEVDSVEVRAK